MAFKKCPGLEFGIKTTLVFGNGMRTHPSRRDMKPWNAPNVIEILSND